MGVKMHKETTKPLTILNILILCGVPAGETTEQLPTDVNSTVLSYLIAGVLHLSPCICSQLIRNFYSFYKYSMILAIQVGANYCFRFKIFNSVNPASIQGCHTI